MRRKSAIAKAWPLLHRIFASRTVPQNGGFCASMHSSSPPHSRVVPAAMGRSLHLDGYKREHLNSQRLDLSGKTTARAERAASERPWGDTLLSSPGAISADAEAQYLFIADSNHHRIIIADGEGKIVDCIGSSAGMEDGTFETAQLCYPASAVFEADRNYLYIADSENHVIRRADLSARTLSTVSRKTMKSEPTMWGRFLTWIGSSQRVDSEQEESQKAGGGGDLRYPWYLKLTKHGSLLVASHRFETFWELDSSSGEVTEVQIQDSEVASEEFCRKAADWNEMEDLHSIALHEMKGNNSEVQNPWQVSSVTDIVSRVVRLDNKLFFMDTESQMIRKYDTQTKSVDTLHLSNLGVLGLPSWWSVPSPSLQSTSCVDRGDNVARLTDPETSELDDLIHIQPGRCLLCVNPLLPKGMAWAAPLEEGSVWRQAQGSVVELSMFGGSLISHKISSAQQWIDDLEDLDDLDSDTETQELTLPPRSDSGIPLYTLVDASLGEGEVTILQQCPPPFWTTFLSGRCSLYGYVYRSKNYEDFWSFASWFGPTDYIVAYSFATLGFALELKVIIDAVLHLKYAAAQELREEFQGPITRIDVRGGLQDRDLQWTDQIFLKHLHIKVRLKIDTSAPEERTIHLSVHL